jgi:hypothetical protein
MQLDIQRLWQGVARNRLLSMHCKAFVVTVQHAHVLAAILCVLKVDEIPSTGGAHSGPCESVTTACDPLHFF